MRNRDGIVFACIFVSFFAGRLSIPPPALGDAQRVNIVTDQENGVIRFVIDGKETAFVDAEGINVRGNVSYGGIQLDFGDTGFDTLTKGRRDVP